MLCWDRYVLAKIYRVKYFVWFIAYWLCYTGTEMQRNWDDDLNWRMFRPRLCRGIHNGRSIVYRC